MDEQKTKHTPGPWTVEVCRAGQSSITGQKYEDSLIQPINVLAERHAAGETSANARLIAAAPELLAALETLVNGRDVNDYKAYEAARAAIRKARQG